MFVFLMKASLSIYINSVSCKLDLEAQTLKSFAD